MTAMPPFVQGRPRVIHEPYELSVNQYRSMGQHGLLAPEDRVELIDGTLLSKPMQNSPHAELISILMVLFVRLLPASWLLRSQSPVDLLQSSPEPDFTIYQGPRHRYRDRHPEQDEIGCIVEVADTTFRFDATTKQELYARNGITVYWQINISAQQVHVFTNPNTVAERYETESIYHSGDTVPLVLAGGEVGAISVASLFPPGEGA